MKKLTEQQQNEILKTEKQLIKASDAMLAILLSIGMLMIAYSFIDETGFNAIIFSTGIAFCFTGYLSKLLLSVLSEISTTLKIQTFGKEDEE